MDTKSNLIEAGKNYIIQQKYQLAEEVFKEASQLDPKNDDIYCELGKICSIQQRYAEAIERLERAIVLNQDNACAHFLLAKAYREKGKYQEAIREFQKTLELNSRKGIAHLDSVDEQVYFELGIVYFTLRRYFDAIENLEKSIKINPDFTYTYPLLTDAYEQQIRLIQFHNFEGRYQEALVEAKRTSQLIPKEKFKLQNILSNEMEIAERKIILSSKVRSLTVTLTNRCNLACLMCRTRNMPWDLPEKTIREIVSFFPHLERIMWQGGEIFLYEGFKDILKEASKFPMRQVIATNGLLIDRESAEIMVKSNVELTFSIDGATKEVYEHIRRGAEFEKVIEKINLINELRKKFNPQMEMRLNVLIMRSNYRQIEQFLDFAKQYKFSTLFFNSTESDFKNLQENVFYYNQDKEVLDYLNKIRDKIAKKAASYGIRLENWLPSSEFLCKTEVSNNQKLNEEKFNQKEQVVCENKKLFCHAPWQRLYIDCGGNVRPDCLCLYDNYIGNILEISLEELWNCEKLKEYRNRIVNFNYQDFCNPACIYGRVPEKNLKFI